RRPLPPVGGKPTVESFTEQEYVIKEGDTFEGISKQFYMKPDYAEALRLYNRNDSLLSDISRNGAEGLKPGQRLSLPHTYSLEKGCGDAIPRVRPAGATVPAPAPGESKKVDVPAPATEITPSPKPVSYCVPEGQGQAMYDIARLTLGNG